MDNVIRPLIYADQGFTLDVSHSGVTAAQLDSLRDALTRAHVEMGRIEAGEIKNPDENRQVTHFTDRLEYDQSGIFRDVCEFFERLRRGKFSGCSGRPFAFVIVNGIGGSALGPQLMQFAIRGPHWNEKDKFERDNYPRIYFLDNTDAAGLKDILEVVDLERTFVVTISKSGSTQETKNNLEAIEQAFAAAKLEFEKHAGAITMEDSQLDQYAKANEWRRIWLMAESIGGRTSVTNVVGHVPAAATGIAFEAFLDGARQMDTWTREANPTQNPAYLLAACWYVLGNGRGDRNMVIVPYSDRLVLLGKYLQQLVMESLGKEHDLQGNVVHQGLTVYGNKGGTDAHAYIQQLQDGRNDFFVTFIEILQDAEQYHLDENMTMGDHLHAFMSGLMLALYARDRSVISITFDTLDERTMGMIIALYERAVAVYAELIGINAFHQPGVQAYKKISKNIKTLNHAVQQFVAENPGYQGLARDIAKQMELEDWTKEVDGILAKFCLNQRVFGGNRIARELKDGRWRYEIVAG